MPDEAGDERNVALNRIELSSVHGVLDYLKEDLSYYPLNMPNNFHKILCHYKIILELLS